MASLSYGDYLIDVSLSGGSGKAHIVSPAHVNISDDGIMAEIEWSSPNYDYMEIAGKEYYPVNTDANSLFVAQIPALDTEIPIRAETTAMSSPHMIDYTLYFDSQSAKKEGGMGGTICICIVAAITAAAVVLLLTRRKSDA